VGVDPEFAVFASVEIRARDDPAAALAITHAFVDSAPAPRDGLC
jgi:hypothetical protein